MKKYTIYLRRNLVNGKCYVGQTKDFKKREWQWKCLKSHYANPNIDEDRELYGLDKFTVEILAETDNRDEAFEIEQRFIADYNSIYPNGYNISTGGYGYSGVEGYWKGKHLSEEVKQKISDAKKGKNNPMYGKLNREDKSKQVYQYTLDSKLVQVWPSTRECGRNDYKQSNVSNCCNGKLKAYKGYRWSYVPL